MSLLSDSEEWVGCEVGLCPGQVASSTFLDLNCTRSGSELSAAPPAKSSGKDSITICGKDIACILQGHDGLRGPASADYFHGQCELFV